MAEDAIVRCQLCFDSGDGDEFCPPRQSSATRQTTSLNWETAGNSTAKEALAGELLALPLPFLSNPAYRIQPTD